MDGRMAEQIKIDCEQCGWLKALDAHRHTNTHMKLARPPLTAVIGGREHCGEIKNRSQRLLLRQTDCHLPSARLLDCRFCVA